MQPRNEPRTGAANELLIYGEIGESYWGEYVTDKDVSEFLKGFGAGDKIVVRINSLGGDVFDGVTIYNLLKSHPAHCTIRVDGAAISAASIIAMAGDEVRMAENAMLMIHDPWTAAMGNARDFRKQADVLDKIGAEQISSAYARKTGMGRDECLAMMAEETWLSAQEALDAGFVDAIDTFDDEAEAGEATESAASAVLPSHIAARYRNIPRTLVSADGGGDRVVYRLDVTGHEKVIAAYEKISEAADRAAKSVDALDNKTTSPANERGANNPGNDMEQNELQAALNTANETIGALKKERDEAKANGANLAKMLDESKANAAALDKQNAALSAERDGALKTKAELELKLTEQEVDALVGDKIASSERDDFVALAQSNRELFDKFVAQRAPMTLLKRDPANATNEPQPAPVGPADNSGSDFDNIVNAAVYG